MSDEVVQETPASPGTPEAAGNRPRKSRKRGKRTRSKQPDATLQGTSTTTETVASPPAPPPNQSRERERGPRRGRHNAANGFADGLDRHFCIAGRRFFPREWPVNHRPGVAIAKLDEVDRRGKEVLLCNHLHEGNCVWPDETRVGAWMADSSPDSEATAKAEPEETADAAV